MWNKLAGQACSSFKLRSDNDNDSRRGKESSGSDVVEA